MQILDRRSGRQTQTKDMKSFLHKQGRGAWEALAFASSAKALMTLCVGVLVQILALILGSFD